ncbi:SDR family NAD(P)-dependent oxidoreductase [Hoyosella subflava]|uniref:Putative short-chain dehydrogenase/reductase n=1 Tax=Hoyosella subflava (strain DSM 45089 / JCM 17490 / NBRC 109087 / DQS3-9A1) TaxID=443218 RepID=F6EFZ8_HOYSD|nr:SDR family NAD(P)-dependent oxidoreductase [Hoyosella subflava]AEF38700.1 Putative short-chain dehydrogenase/reductase [Hoyosella subflava DQS3-9A1]
MRRSTLNGLRIAITGGARGIGLATAKELHARGATVVIGDLDVELATQAASGISAKVRGLTLDVSDHASYAAFVRAATADGPLDVLGCLHGMSLTLPAMLDRGSGHIINVASTAGKTPVPGGVAYCATKSAVVALTETARVEHSGSGVAFTCVMPHFTNTELIAGTRPTRLIPVIEPEDVAKAIADAVATQPKDVFVPKLVGTILRTQPLFGRRLRDSVSSRLGAYDTFLTFDRDERAAYDDRLKRY